MLIISNLLFDEWIEIFGLECLIGVLFDCLIYYVNIFEMNGESYCFG